MRARSGGRRRHRVKWAKTLCTSRFGFARPRRLAAEPLEERRLLSVGAQLLSMISDSPPYPTGDISDHVVARNGLPSGAVLLGDVPTSRWTYGCTATSAGMVFGYYDRTGYPNMYTGPANGGVCPLEDLGQGIEAVPIAGSCSIIATRAGFDGRPAGSPGHVDDYWTGYGDSGPDPWEAAGVEHAWGECTADFLGTNQWKWDLRPKPDGDGNTDTNTDGGTQWFAWNDGRPDHDPLPPQGSGSPRTGCAHGMRLFAESRGYRVTANYSQLSDNEHEDGFSFSDLKSEIDQGFPVIIHVEGHTMVALGYNDADNTIYIHNTWDNDLHWMQWGGSYAGMSQLGVTVFHLDPAQQDPMFDYGDAPEQNTSYPTTLAQNGARHTVVPGIHLGSANDTDSDGQPTREAAADAAEGDDRDGLPDDEDGVTFLTHLLPGELAQIEVEASCVGRFNGWIDFNRDWDWNDADEQVFIDIPLDSGMNTLTLMVPLTAVSEEYTYARFRFNSAGGLSYDGPANDGEVEDYRVLIGLPQIRGEKWADLDGNGRRDAGEPGLVGWRVFCDLDGDGQWDAGEPYGITNAQGEYVIRGLDPGTYLVREEPQTGWMQTFPGGGTPELDLVTVGAPAGAAEGNHGTVFPFDIGLDGRHTEMRYQQIYAASAFQFQEAGSIHFSQGGYIDQIRFRRDGVTGAPFSTSGIDVQINLGYARRGPADPAEHFASNITDEHVAGEGYVTVFDGLLDLSSGDLGGPPRLFDIVIDVEDLFYYDPRRGDLLLDIRLRNAPMTTAFDAVVWPENETTSRVWAGDLSAETGEVGSLLEDGRPLGLVTQFALNPQAYTVPVEQGRISQGYDFGNAPLGQIRGTKWYDQNSNGVQDGGEPGLENWLVYIDTNNNGRHDPDELYALTDASGNYTITDVPPGYHIVAEGHPYGWNQTFPNDPQRELLGLGSGPVGAGAIYDVNFAAGTASNDRRISLSASTGIARGPDGMLYTVNGDVGVPVGNALYRVNPLTGSVQLVGQTGLDAVFEGDLDFDPTTGRLYGAHQWESTEPPYTSCLFELEPATGRASLIGEAIECDFAGMAFDQTGTLWVADAWNNRLLTIDKANGQILTEVPLSQPISLSVGMDFDPATGTLYLADAFDVPNELYTVDTATGVMTLVGETMPDPGGGLWGLEFMGGPAGTHLVSVGWGQTVSDVDFGNWTDAASGRVQGRTWNDLDGDGLGAGQEPGLDDWRVYLDLDWSGDWEPGEPHSYSNPDGYYTLAGLAQGEYLVAMDAPEGWQQTYPPPVPQGLFGVAPWGYVEGQTFLHALDTQTGQPTEIGQTGVTQLIGLAADEDGTLYAISAADDPGNVRHLYTMDPATGAATALFDLGTSDPFVEGCLEMMPGTDQVYVITYPHLTGGYSPEMFLIDVSDQTLTSLGTLWWAGGSTADWLIDGLCFRGTTLYGLVDHRYAAQGPLNDHLVTIDTQTREIVDVGPLGVVIQSLAGLAYNPDADVFYAAGGTAPPPYPPPPDKLYQVDPVTGQASLIGDTALTGLSGLVYLPKSDQAPGTHRVVIDQGAIIPGVDFGYKVVPATPTDWGDAPEAYWASGGASHDIAQPYLGRRVDHDGMVGEPSELALGDDLRGEDDEDGVVLPDFYAGEAATVWVEVVDNGFLYGWFDWNGDGTWQHPAELEIATGVSTGWHSFEVSVPADVAEGLSFARFRVSADEDLPPTGPGGPGEVEDHAITILPEPWDFGDAPSPYPTRAEDDGACHKLHVVDNAFLGPYLGDRPDAEPDGQRDAGALGDDDEPPYVGDDEDGVTLERYFHGSVDPLPELMPGLEGAVHVEISAMGAAGSCWLGGWIDFNSDGIWQHPEEQVVGELIHADGPYEFTFAVPEDAVLGETFARFRVSTEADLLPTGPAPDGEVEDHAVQIVQTVLTQTVPYEWPVAEILLRSGDDEELVPMIGQVLVELGHEGPKVGDARDDDNDGLDELQIRIVDVTLSGMSSDGPIQVRLRDGAECTGQIEETTDIQTGRLDLPPFAASGTADAFFNLLLEADLPDGRTRVHHEQPLRFEGLVSSAPFGLGDRLAFAPGVAVPLFDQEGFESSVTLIGASCLPNPVTETDVYEGCEGEIVLGLPGGGEESVALSGPATFAVYFGGPAEGDAEDNDADGLDDVVVQLVEANLTGPSSLGPVEVRLQQGMTMLGLIEETANSAPGVLDLPPFGSDGTTANSFFDAHFEINVGGQTFHTAAPKRMSGLITHTPAAPGDIYENSEVTPMVDVSGNLGQNLSMGMSASAAGSYLGHTRLEPIPLPEIASIEPGANTHTAPVGTNVSATYDQDVDPASVTDETFVVHAVQTGQLTAPPAAISTSGPTVTLDPAADFHPGELVQATATGGIQNLDGEPAWPYVWQFRAATAGGTGFYIDSGQRLGSLMSSDVALGDVDGDGDLDAFVGNWYGYSPEKVWLNDGSGDFIDSGQALTFGGDSPTVALGDLDGDGDLDAFVATFGGHNLVYLNSYPEGTFRDSGQRLGNASSVSLALGDVDGDGDLDAMVGNHNQVDKLWLNQGDGTFVDSGQSLGGLYSRGVALGDVDSDGDLDLFVTYDLGRPNQVWLNDGLGNFSDSGQMLGAANSRQVALGDLDGDGDLDAFVANKGDPDTVWVNDGSGAFIDSGQALGSANSSQVALGDLDGDGDLDAVVTESGADSPTTVWLNDSAGTFSEGMEVPGSDSTTGIALGDVDGDGDLDAFFAKSSGTGAPNQVWLNQGAPFVLGTDPTPGSHTAPVGTNVSATYDQDLDPASVTDETFVVHAMQTSQLTEPPAAISTSGPTVTLDPAYDFHPGELVQVTATTGIKNAVGLAPDGPYVWQFRTAVTGGSGVYADSGEDLGSLLSKGAAFGDLDGDGDLDAFVANYFQADKVWLNDGAGTFTDSGQELGNFASSDVSLGDFDVDGDLDAFVAVFHYGNKVWLNDGLGTFTDSGQSLGDAHGDFVAAGDVDGDGDLDALVMNYNEEGSLWLNDGTGTFTDSGQSPGGRYSHRVALGDLDGDGDLDAFVMYYGKPDEVWLNDGAGTFTDSGQRLGSSAGYGIALGDLDGDGDLDAFVTDWEAPNKVWLNDGSATFADSGQSLGSWTSHYVALGDVDADGDLDAMVANSDPGNPSKLWLNDSLGSFSEAPVDLGDYHSLAVELGDADGDGDLDALFANSYQPNQVWINIGADYGDAPDPTYPTLSSSGGASHTIVPGFFLGEGVDGEPNGQPNDTARGDDLDGSDDEDGVTFKTLAVGETTELTVKTSAEGRLDAWIDFNGDGDWADADEQIFTDEALTAGENNLSFLVPATAHRTETYARFRFSSAGGLDFGGKAEDGEVEDYMVEIRGLDFGDAPEIYPTKRSDNGARHVVHGGVCLGTLLDSEPDGQPDPDALGDDLDGVDDEDGVVFTSTLVAGETALVDVTTTGEGHLNAWIDFNGDGDFADSDEQIFADEALSADTHHLSFPVPIDVTAEQTYARFRFSTTAGLDYKGVAPDGEVEDYAVEILGWDFGDAQGPGFPTKFSQDGARHLVGGSLFLGSLIDRESDGLPHPDAEGDDLDNLDDEDGIELLAPLVPGRTVEVNVTVSARGTLNAWVDFNNNGRWDDAGEHAFIDVDLSPGAPPLPINVPPDAVIGTTVARFRFNDKGGLSFDGPALSGEVEDYVLPIMPAVSINDVTAAEGDPEFTLVADINSMGDALIIHPIFGPMPLVSNGALYFMADDGTAGHELWKSDGTEAGTVLVKDINPGEEDSFPIELTVWNDELYFLANDGATGRELWKSDGTETGTVLLKDINLGTGESIPYEFTSFHGELYFHADDGATGSELWKTDGTEAGTVRVQDVYPGPESSNPRELIVFDDHLYFIANVSPAEEDLWKTDGTAAGTVRVDDVSPETPLRPWELVIFDDYLYFTARDELIGHELWRTDGTAAGTERIIDLRPGPEGSNPQNLTVFSGELYFVANDGVVGDELWKTDGTEAGTVLVKDICPGSHLSDPRPQRLVVFDGVLYFAADDGVTGRELWKTDGTEVGTVRVKDINPGAGDSAALLGPISFNGELYFTADDGVAGRELWKTDGTEAGTVRVEDIYPGESGSEPGLKAVFDGALYFSACDEIAGREVWKYSHTSFEFTVTLSHESDFPVAVQVDTADGTALVADRDYVPLSGYVLTFAPGQMSQTVRVAVIPDTKIEPDETFTVLLSHADGGWIADGEGLGTILNDEVDYGDAPESYGTLAADDGARHTLNRGGLYLGAAIDGEADGQPHPMALGDDNMALDDEDGVRFTSRLMAGEPATLEVTASNKGFLDAWIDYNRDGDWADPGEHVFVDESLNPGPNDLSIDVPAAASSGRTFARFRFSRDGGLSFDGPAADGEVEDYQVSIVSPGGAGIDGVLRDPGTLVPAGDEGEADTLPDSLEWIDEWGSLWVEIWGHTPYGTDQGVRSFSVDLDYDTDLFSATLVEYGPAFTEDQSGSIDDAAGRVDDVGARTVQDDVGDDKYVLLARVLFESLPGDAGCPHNADGQYITPVTDLGIALAEMNVDLVAWSSADVETGDPPATEAWPVMYDVDDDRQVGFGDLAYFATAFQQMVGDPGAPFAWACDFDRSGRVDFGDLAFFGQHFLSIPGSQIVYPAGFPEAWRIDTTEPAGLAEFAAAEGLQAPDRASLHDAALSAYLDGMEADGNRTRLPNDLLRYACCMLDFNRMQTTSSSSSDTKNVAEAVDVLIAQGYW